MTKEEYEEINKERRREEAKKKGKQIAKLTTEDKRRQKYNMRRHE